MGRMALEDYNVAIQDFHDSLRGLDAAIQEALGRCDQARLACGKVRLVYEDEQAQRASTRSRFHCPEREAIEEQYLLAVIAYGDALNTIQLRPRVVNEAEGQRIERARNTCWRITNGRTSVRDLRPLGDVPMPVLLSRANAQPALRGSVAR